MADFIRSLLQVLLGFILGVGTMLYLIPDDKTPKVATPVAGGKGTAVTQSPAASGTTSQADEGQGTTTLFGRRSGGSTDTPGAPTTDVATVTTPVVPAANPEPVAAEPTPVAVVPPVAVVEEPVDFRELCIKPAAWPPIITLNKEINAQVMQDEAVIAEIPLSAGEKLQVSKVFGDGTAEVRAKGAKFVVKAADTDLAAQARVRLAEISGRPRAPLATQPTAVEPAPAVRPNPATPAPQQPARGNDLDSKMRSLFGTPEKR